MITFENTLEVARPPELVFAALADLTRVPDWNYYVRSVTQVTPGPVTIGTIFHQVRQDDEQDFEITVLAAPRRLTVATLPRSRPTFRRDIEVAAVGAGSRVTDRWQLDTGQPEMIQRLGRTLAQRAVAQNLGCLRELLESGNTRLPDGRTVRW